MEARDFICELIVKLEGRNEIWLKKVRLVNPTDDLVVEDPVAMRSKGGPKRAMKQKKCNKCRSSEHNIHSYPKFIGDVTSVECDLSTDSEGDVGSYDVLRVKICCIFI